MCEPTMALFAISGAIGAAGSLQAGSAAASAHKSNASAYDFMRTNRLEKAAFDVSQADRKFSRFSGTRDAQIGASGISADSFSDVRADDAGEHALENAATMWSAHNEATMLQFQSDSERVKAKDAKVAGYLNAASSVVKAASGYASSATPKASNGVTTASPWSTPVQPSQSTWGYL